MIGGVLAALGAVLGIVAFTETDWFDGADESHFGTVHDELALLQQAHVASGLAVAYFSWLAPLLLALAVVAAALAQVFDSAAVGVAGLLAGLAGVACTVLALKLVGPTSAAGAQGAPETYGGYLQHASIAFYLAAAAFVALAVSSALAMRRALVRRAVNESTWTPRGRHPQRYRA